MAKELHDYRKSYEKGELLEENLGEYPWMLFQQWFEEAEQSGEVEEPNAVAVSTIGEDGFPKTRIVLLKATDKNTFTFYTNYTSEKGQAIAHNNHICLSFFWPGLERQVIIKGIAKKTDPQTADAYFASRPKGSQLGAWASDQSLRITSREVLEKSLKALEEKYANKEVPRPPHWGGFTVTSHEMEFWQGRPNRLHDRIRYVVNDQGEWIKERLAP
ncbi:pyridoxamine 5'-phosphate oxidase [Gangjinia marincola]|uniref:Pyridoxine/pyridoxamine 5'-phosphate oxidase n=1 Tax=Gangjinia marincola TaxID=578463 RepID=A0ABP3XS85_9FLAO